MKTKNIRRALVMSLVAMMLCIAMLAGSTFAWFTDSVVSGNNIIKSGTLDIDMKWADGKADPADTTIWNDASTGTIFNYDLWEPGYTEVRHIQIINKGTLALKYQLEIAAEGTVSDLADVIDVYYLDPATAITSRDQLAGLTPIGTLSDVLAGMGTSASGVLLPGQTAPLNVTIALKMQESAGNEYQDKALGASFAVKLFATQYTYEEDSFDDQYDADAEYPAAEVNNAPDLIDALADGKDAKLTGDVDLSANASNGNFVIPASAGEVTLDLNGYTLTAPAREGYTGRTQYALDNYADLTITGNGTVVSRGVQNYGKLTVEEGVTLVANDTNGGAAIYAYAGSETTVNGATLTAQNEAACIIAYGKLTVNGGTYTQTGTGKTYAVLTYADAVINNANVTGVHGAVCGDTNLTINGGNYVTTGVVGQSDHVVYGSANSAIVITDGTFNGDYDAGGKSIWVGGTASITGGVFGTDPSAYVADGYNAALNAEGKWVVSAN